MAQLLAYVQNGSLVLSNDVLSSISQIDNPAVLCMYGSQFSGKSTLLNALFLPSSEARFHVETSRGTKIKGVEACVVEGFSGRQVLVFDLQGVGRLCSSLESELVSLFLLVSSVFIYNTIGGVDESVVRTLLERTELARTLLGVDTPASTESENTVLQHGRRLSYESGLPPKKSPKRLTFQNGHVDEKLSDENGSTSKELGTGPLLQWIVRDCRSDTLLQEGRKVSVSARMESFIQKRPRASADHAGSFSRNPLLDLFKKRECMVLPAPSSDDAELAEIGLRPYQYLPPEFRSQVEALRSKLLTSLAPKTLNGEPVTGALLAKLLKFYVDAFQSSKRPPLSIALGPIVDQEMNAFVESAAADYRSKFTTELQDKLPSEQADIREIHRKCKSDAMAIVMSCRLPGDKALYLNKLKEIIRATHIEIGNAYEEVCRTECLECFNDLYAAVENKLQCDFYASIDMYDAERRQVFEEYKRIARRPQGESAFVEAVVPRIVQALQRIYERQRFEWEMEKAILVENIRGLKKTAAASAIAYGGPSENNNTLDTSSDQLSTSSSSIEGTPPRLQSSTATASQLVAASPAPDFVARLSEKIKDLEEKIRKQEQKHETSLEALKSDFNTREKTLKSQIGMAVEKQIDAEREVLRMRLYQDDEKSRLEETVKSLRFELEEMQRRAQEDRARALASMTLDAQTMQKTLEDERTILEEHYGHRVKALEAELADMRDRLKAQEVNVDKLVTGLSADLAEQRDRNNRTRASTSLRSWSSFLSSRPSFSLNKSNSLRESTASSQGSATFRSTLGSLL
mmetsp:Transcript_3202/g.4905  ORF Transcript_3202/g.4905 Transcript_3202/m.4905 type:complete len:801 (-) Transcript_3202:659-3061(-)